MAKNDPKSRGGGGFDFEDKVGAYFATFLASRTPLFPDLGLPQLQRIKFQRSQNWKLDDVILEFGNEIESVSVALSLKSNSQLTASKLPDDFIDSAWQQFLMKENNLFRRGTDYLGLVTLGASRAAQDSLRDLLSMRGKHSKSDFSPILKGAGFTNSNVRAMYSSIERPGHDGNSLGINAYDILSRMLVVDFDFGLDASERLQAAFRNLSELVSAQDCSLAWDVLQALVKSTRIVGGEIDFGILQKSLQGQFKLSRYVRSVADFITLKKNFSLQLGIFGKGFADKYVLLHETNELAGIDPLKVNVVIGPSGLGKTSLLLQWCRHQRNSSIVWITSASISKAGSIHSLHTVLGLETSLESLLKSESNLIVVLDSIDRINQEHDLEILREIVALMVQYPMGGHRYFLVSQDQFWGGIMIALSASTALFNVIQALPLTDADILHLVQRFPAISAFLRNLNTREILRNRKYMDLAITIAQSGSKSDSVQLSGLIDGFCRIASNDRPELMALLLRIACEQADARQFESASSKLSSIDSENLQQLVRNGIFASDSSGIRFEHDLYGDWLRRQYLIEDRAQFTSKVKSKSYSVFWHEAIRLASLYIFEIEGSENWKAVLDKLKNEDCKLELDLCLDVAITSPNQGNILRKLMTFNAQGSKFSIGRILDRFLSYGTVPNPYYVARSSDMKISLIAASQIDRIPIASYWSDVIQFLYENRSSIPEFLNQAAKISEKWLSTEYAVRKRKEAAEVAFACADWAFRFRYAENGIFSDDAEKDCYRALLAAHREIPDTVEVLCKKLAGLIERGLTKPQRVVSDQEINRKKLSFPNIPSRRKVDKRAWSLGPQFSKDRAFQDVLYEYEAFSHLAKSSPEFAGKLLLAAMIENPIEWEDLYEDRIERKARLALDEERDFFPLKYSSGPFYMFFRVAPRQAIETLASVANFATDRWTEREKERGSAFLGVEFQFFGKNVFWRGNSDVYLWSSSWSNGPPVLATFLIAFETWLLNEIKEKKDVSHWIRQAVELTDSLSILGVLVSVGRSSPSLLINLLKELMIEPHFIWWEDSRVVNGTARETAPSLRSMLQYFFLNQKGELDLLIEDSRKKWKKSFMEEPDAELEALYHQLDRSNYRQVSSPNGGDYFEYIVPKEFLDRHKKRFENADLKYDSMMLPQEIGKLINAPESITKEALEKIQGKIAQLKLSPDAFTDDIMPGIRDLELGVCGIEILVDSLSIYPLSQDRVALSKSSIEQAISQMYTDAAIQRRRHFGIEASYDVLLASVFGAIVSRREDNSWARSMLALIVLGPGRGTQIAAMTSLQVGGASPKLLLQFLNLVFTFSKLESLWERVDRYMKYGSSQEDQPQAIQFLAGFKIFRVVTGKLNHVERERLFRKMNKDQINLFSKGSISAQWPFWSYTAKELAFSRGILLRRSDLLVIDVLDFVKCASKLPNIAATESLHDGWVDFCREGIVAIEERVRSDLDEDGRVSSFPHEQDRWLIGQLAVSYYLLGDSDLEEVIRTFFSLGPDASNWLDDFGYAFFVKCRDDSADIDLRCGKLRKLVEIVQDVFGLIKKSRDADDVWCSILGLSEVNVAYAEQKHSNFYLKLFPVIEEVMSARRGSRKIPERFALLLLTSAGNSIRFRGLPLLAKELQVIGLDQRPDSWETESYSRLLVIVFQENRIELEADETFRGAFEILLRRLLEVQNVDALEVARQWKNSKGD